MDVHHISTVWGQCASAEEKPQALVRRFCGYQPALALVVADPSTASYVILQHQGPVSSLCSPLLLFPLLLELVFVGLSVLYRLVSSCMAYYATDPR